MLKGDKIKLFKFILPIISILGMIIFYFFHTSSGLEKLSAYLTQELSKNVRYEIKLDVKEVHFSFSNITTTIMINNVLELALLARISPLDNLYDIRYHLRGEEVHFSTVSFNDILDLKGTIKGKKEDFVLKGEGKAFEGGVHFSLHHQAKKDKDIILQMQKVSATKIFQLFNQKPLFAGTFTLDANLPLFSKFEKRGDITLDIQRGGLYLKNIKELYGLQFPDDFMIAGSGEIHLANDVHTFDAQLHSNVADITFTRGKIRAVDNKITALYHLDIEDLSRLQFLTKKRYSSAFLADGELEYLNTLRFDGQSDSLAGKLDYYYEKGALEVRLEALSMAKLFKVMDYPTIMIGNISGKVEVDIAKDITLVNLRSPNLHFKPSALIDSIYNASSVDIAKEIFTKTYFTAIIENSVVFYDFKAENKGSHIYFLEAKMDAKANTINATFDISMQDEALCGEIYGSLKSPQVKVDVAKYIEFKAKKEIDEFFGVGTSAKVKKELEEVDLEDVKGFIKGFF